VSQVSRAMTQVDQVTQQNASAAEELSSTAEELAAQAESLSQLVGYFRLGQGSVASTANTAKLAVRPAATPRAPQRLTKHVPLPTNGGADSHDFVRF